MSFLLAYEVFWQKNPALLYGVAIAAGCMFALGSSWEAAGIWTLLLAPLMYKPTKTLIGRLALAFLLSLSMSAWIQQSHSFPEIPDAGIKGHGAVDIASLARNKHIFGDRFIYRGTLLYFIPVDSESPLKNLKNIPITVSVPNKESLQRPSADLGYLIGGILKETQNGTYILQTSTEAPWIPLSAHQSLAERRYQFKEAVAEQIKKNYHTAQSRSFLTGIATGTFDDRLMANDLGRFGLQHIMAISGFHFALIAAFFSLVFVLFLPQRIAVVALVFLLTCYFVFLGATPSIMRAWIMSLIALLAVLFERKSGAINSLGIALGAVLIYDPLKIHHLGFQFSFATTMAILLLYSPLDALFQKVLKKRTLPQALSMPLIDKHAYIILCMIRKGCALAVAVNLAAIPLTLHYFHKFPVLSLLFNLFFPFLVSVSMILLILGFAFSFVPWLGAGIHSLNDAYTQMILNLTAYTPKAFDLYLRTTEWPPWAALAIISVLFFFGIYWQVRQEEQKLQEKDWLFV